MIKACADKAKSVDPRWVVNATRQLRVYALNADRPFTIEEARHFVEKVAPRPEGIDGRVWGHITKEAVGLGLIKRVRGVYRPASSSHGAAKPVYRA
jgi:hypothetical protein